MGFSRQEYWSELPCPSPGDLLDPGIQLLSLMSPALAGRFSTAEPPENPKMGLYQHLIFFSCFDAYAISFFLKLEKIKKNFAKALVKFEVSFLQMQQTFLELIFPFFFLFLVQLVGQLDRCIQMWRVLRSTFKDQSMNWRQWPEIRKLDSLWQQNGPLMSGIMISL